MKSTMRGHKLTFSSKDDSTSFQTWSKLSRGMHPMKRQHWTLWSRRGIRRSVPPHRRMRKQRPTLQLLEPCVNCLLFLRRTQTSRPIKGLFLCKKNCPIQKVALPMRGSFMAMLCCRTTLLFRNSLALSLLEYLSSQNANTSKLKMLHATPHKSNFNWIGRSIFYE